MKKQISLIALSLLALAGCVSTGSDSASTDPKSSSTTISSINFNRPDKIQWDEVKGNGNAIIYTPKGVDHRKTPIKFVYQQVAHNQDPQAIAKQIIQPIQANCEKPVTNAFKSKSAYPNQLNYQTLCNKFKNASFGMVNYVDIFTDSQGSHILIAEVKTPPSTEPGKLDAPQTEAEKKAAQNTVAFIKLAQKAMTEVAVCDASGNCQ